jgi:oligosaccharyltransferase complex subunit alpha (ribophorin I)
LVRVKSTILFANTGGKSHQHVYHAVSKSRVGNLAFLAASSTKGQPLGVQRMNGGVAGLSDDFVYYKIALPDALAASASVKITVRESYHGLQEPYPLSIAQSESQLVRYADNVYVSSPYTVQSQKTTVRLASATVESFSTQVQPVARKGQLITYGPFEDQAPFSAAPLKVHFENNTPFLKASRASKEIEVSHWGNVAVEQKFYLQHAGAKLKGSFSRYEYQRNPLAAKSAVRQVRLQVPAAARDFYYRDEIGNISTSAVQRGEHGTTLQLVPRYVLFGGWKAAFCVGYNVPAAELLSRDAADDQMYMLNVSFYARWKEHIPTDDYEFSVTLPEGATDIQFHAPFAVSQDAAPGIKFTYLDTVGRPVLRVRKQGVVLDHDQYVQVTYRFSQNSLLHEPMLLFSVFFAVCLAAIVYTRVNFSLAAISGARDGAGAGAGAGAAGGARGATRIAETVARLRDVLERRDRLHSALDAALAKLAKTRNKQIWDAEQKAVADGMEECKRDGLRLAGEMEQLDAQKGAIMRQVDAAERARLKAHLAVAAHESMLRQVGSPDAAHESKRLELERTLQEADDLVERLASTLIAE